MEIYRFFSSMGSLIFIGGVLYLIFRGRGERGENHGKDAYFYVVCFLGLAMLVWGLADCFRLVLSQWWTEGYPAAFPLSYESYIKQIAMRLSVIVVSLPVYAFHWARVMNKSGVERDAGSRRMYLGAVLIISLAVVLSVGTWLVYQGFLLVLGAGSTRGSELAFALPYTVTAAIVWTWHFGLWREGERRFRESVEEK